MDVEQMIGAARDTLTVKRVFGEPLERDGLTVIPVASVSGGGGGGQGEDQSGQKGRGGGVGLQVRPAGAYVIKDGVLTWRPAPDLNRIVGTVGMVLVAYILMRPRVIHAKSRAAVRAARRS